MEKTCRWYHQLSTWSAFSYQKSHKQGTDKGIVICKVESPLYKCFSWISNDSWLPLSGEGWVFAWLGSVFSRGEITRLKGDWYAQIARQLCSLRALHTSRIAQISPRHARRAGLHQIPHLICFPSHASKQNGLCIEIISSLAIKESRPI